MLISLLPQLVYNGRLLAPLASLLVMTPRLSLVHDSVKVGLFLSVLQFVLELLNILEVLLLLLVLLLHLVVFDLKA